VSAHKELTDLLAEDILNTEDGAGSDLDYSRVEEDGVWIAVRGNLDISALASTILRWHDAKVAAL
jgi:hypothetical protein